MTEDRLAPINSGERYMVLDALRGFALLGIILANFPEFSLYSFMSRDATEIMPTANIDGVVRYLLYFIVDGKFYTMFSLLFGIGFSIILSNARKKGKSGTLIFYRRMICLFLIGLAHLIFLWSGDILMLYALVGMTLPLFTRLKNRTLLFIAGGFLLIPVVIDYFCQWFHLNPSSAIVGLQWELCGRYGITEDNFAYWLHDATNYSDMFKFLVQGAVERMQEFVDGNRYFKVLGLFLVGYVIGRNKLYAHLQSHRKALSNVFALGVVIGLPLSAIYAYSSVQSHPWGLGFHSLLYFVSVYVTAFGYVAGICLLYVRYGSSQIWSFLAAPGRMALTNYISQSAAGIFIFYGIGLGFGTMTGLVYVEAIAMGVFLLETIVSQIWLGYFRFGPLEWIWRCLTYGRFFNILNKR